MFAARAIAFGHQLRQQRWIILDHPCPPPDLHPSTVGIVHQKQERATVIGEISGGYVLAVARIIGETKRPFIDLANESLRPAAVLRIGLPVRIGGRQIGSVDLT